ncbi:hypothetical protein BCD48_43475 [Pseudofrankia sp. BMG5.36]|nr:hypothetical protein BCD48_43475 [Pseudofrankia sp. BMG5.36]
MSESEPHSGLGFSDLFDLLRVGLTLTSIDDGRVRRANEFACQLLGRDAREVVGRDWHELVDPMQVDELRAIDPGDVLAGRLDWRQRTIRFVRPDGQVTHVLACGSRVIIDGDRCFLSQIQDITELVATHRQLQLVLDNTPVSVFLLDHDGRVLTSGGAAHQLPAAMLRQVTGSSVFTAFRDHPAVLAMVRRSLRGERVHEVLSAGGHWYDVHLVPVPGAAAQRPSVAGVASDVTELERASAELRVRTNRQTALADLAQQALEVADEDVLWDRGTRTLTEQIGAEVMIVRGRPASDRIPAAWAASDDSAGVGADPSAPYNPMVPAHLNGGDGLQGRVLSDGGVTTPATEPPCTVVRVPVGPADEPVATICLRGAGRRRTSDDAAFIRSVSAILGSAVLRIHMEQDTRFRSLHDPLTGLPNRAALLDALRRSLSRTGRNQTRTGVLFVDLDGFKAVNDTLGHQAGDKLLTTVATRLRHAVRPGDVAGRLAGDEFAVLCEGIGSLDDLQAIGERVIQALEPTVELRRPVNVSASVGAALSGPDLADAEALITAADVAMYEAKRQGRGCLVRYDEPVRATHAARLRNVTALQHALGERRLDLQFLPIARQTGPIVAVEAIPCWPHPARHALAPEDFEPIAVDAGLSSDLDLWLVDNAIRYAHDAAGPDGQTPMTASTVTIRDDKRWDEGRKASPKEIWIRLSAHSFSDPDLRRRIIARATGSTTVAGHGLTLCIVIPDKLRAEDHREIDAAIDQLADAGVAVRLDYAETTPLGAMTPDHLPSGLHGVSLSEQYVHSVDHSDATAAVLAGIVCFAHLLHLDVAARGVDTPSELDAIRALDCDLAQGAAVGQALPMPPW